MPGLQDVRVTLYDIFGYLLPGLVAFAALAVFVWAALLPGSALHEPTLGAPAWFALLTFSYVLGHLVQAIASGIPFMVQREHDVLEELGDEVTRDILQGTRAEKDSTAYHICDEMLAQTGQTGDREIYQYREGFYRGLTVAFSLGIVAVIVRAARAGATLRSGHTTHSVPTTAYVVASIFLAVATWLAYRRYRRFSEYKIRNAFVAFLIETERLPAP
jgi:hypothetical protein